MPVTIQAILQSPEGSELGVRLFDPADLDSQVGSDIILAQNGTRNVLYSGSETVAVGEYSVDLFNTDGSETIEGDSIAAGNYLNVTGATGTFEILASAPAESSGDSESSCLYDPYT